MEIFICTLLIVIGWFLIGYLTVIINNLFIGWGILYEEMTITKSNFSGAVCSGLLGLVFLICVFCAYLARRLWVSIISIYEKLRDFAINLAERKNKEE